MKAAEIRCSFDGASIVIASIRILVQVVRCKRVEGDAADFVMCREWELAASLRANGSARSVSRTVIVRESA